MSSSTLRRDFLKYALASALAIPVMRGVGARAGALTPLDPADPLAQSLGFVPDAKAAASANPAFKPGQHCGVCAQYQGKASDPSAGCAIFAGHSVPSRGWCGAFQQRT